MLYSPTGGADAIKLRWAISPPATSRRSNYVIRDGAGMRLVAAMAEPHPAVPGWHPTHGAAAASRISPFVEEVAENDAQYFRRRAGEERRAADEAAGPEARAAHADMAERYARLSEQWISSPSFARPQSTRSASLAALLRRRFGLPDRMPGPERFSPVDAAARPLAGPSGQAAQVEIPRKLIGQSHRSSVAERKRRLDVLLDEALLGSFPASDPVSIAHVR